MSTLRDQTTKTHLNVDMVFAEAVSPFGIVIAVADSGVCTEVLEDGTFLTL